MRLPSIDSAAIDDASSMVSGVSLPSVAAPRAYVPRSIMADAVQIQDDDILTEATAGHRVTPITNPNVLKRYASIIHDTKLESQLYRGNIVDASYKAVIKHLVEDWEDHINETSCPRIYNDLSFKYSINRNTETTKYFAIDGIYLDLLKSSGVYNAPKPCVRFIFSNQVLATLNKNFWRCSRCTVRSLIMDNGMSFVNARVDNENPASLTLVHTHVDQKGCVLSATHENVGLLTDPDLEAHVYKVSGFFTARFGAVNQVLLDLVGVHAFSIHDDLFNKNKLVNATAFGV